MRRIIVIGVAALLSSAAGIAAGNTTVASQTLDFITDSLETSSTSDSTVSMAPTTATTVGPPPTALSPVSVPITQPLVELTPQTAEAIPSPSQKFQKLGDDFFAQLQPQSAEIAVITGNVAADDKIRLLATERGYKLRPQVVTDQASTGGQVVNEAIVDSWLELQAAAASDGVDLRIVSGYRSVEAQRKIFLAKLDEVASDYSLIVNGSLDAELQEILEFSAPPGYSKHHSGFAIDIDHDETGFDSFAGSAGFEWMSANNYANSTKFGFIPSYPSGVERQGPVPESWEYVWIGELATS